MWYVYLMATTAPTASTLAAAFMAEATDLGFQVSVKPGLVTIYQSFTPGDRDAYVRCDGDGPVLLLQCPIVAPGSTWGTDGASVGGHAGLVGGYYRLNTSGVSKRFTTALAKLI